MIRNLTPHPVTLVTTPGAESDQGGTGHTEGYPRTRQPSTPSCVLCTPLTSRWCPCCSERDDE